MKTLTAFFDLDFLPCSYDAVTQLVHAKFVAQERGCDALHVVIVPNSKTGFAREWGKHDAAATQWRFWHIVVAAMPLAGATVTVAASRDQAAHMQFECDQGRIGCPQVEQWWPKEKAHFLRPLVEASRSGKTIPKLRATDAARRYVEAWNASREDPSKPFITITLRNQSTDPDRNSNESEWNEFHAHLTGDCGYEVIALRDTNKALQEPAGNFSCVDIDLRLALYERAGMNLLPNGGPQELCKLSAAPYLAFGQAITPGWADHFRKYFAMEPGTQLPWAAQNQRLVYAPDSFENLTEEFQKWESMSK